MPALTANPVLLDAAARHRLDGEGYLVLPGAVPAGWIGPLCAAFDAGVIPSDQWPVPRQREWRHAQVDLDPLVQRVCRLPVLIAAAAHLIGGPFFLAQVEGREPCRGNAAQPLHRDGTDGQGQAVVAMVWLDGYGADNGATQLVPGRHRGDVAAAAMGAAQVVSGAAGDILVFHPDVLHGATTNHSGARRRSLLLSYAAAALHAQYRATEALRGVRMDTGALLGDAAPGNGAGA